MLLLKNLLFTAFVPGSLTVLLPHWIVTSSPESAPAVWQILHFLALLPGLLGIGIYLWCMWDFATFGRGTPAPIDPPKHLVVHGLYRFVRNPMYVGVLLILLSEAAFFQSWRLLAYAGGIFLMVHTFTVFYEEPTLERQFGASYRRYRQTVRRWLPGKRNESDA